MLSLLFRFPGGRYHATPWGHHVNEGLVEWPPCPWRLLRALIATAHTKLDAPDPLPPGHALRRIVGAMAGTLPTYHLPPVRGSMHSRHYMPLATLEKGNEKTTMVLDSCAMTGDAPLTVSWPVTLDEEALGYLARLLAAMSYLGRAESWVDARLIGGSALPTDSAGLMECVPVTEGTDGEPGWEQVPLLAPLPEDEYGAWRDKAAEKALEHFPLPEGGRKPAKALLNKRARAMAPYPPTLFDCLTSDNSVWRGHGWSQPPGSKRVTYWRKTDRPVTVRREAIGHAPDRTPVEAVLLALASDTRQGEVLPMLSRSLPQAELLHRALISRFNGTRHPVLSGRDTAGGPLSGHHHLHILPLSLDIPGRLDHFLLWAPMGMDEQARDAILRVRHTWTKGGEKPLFVSVAGMGSVTEIAGGLHPASGLVAKAGSWTSYTPFVPPRHVKRRGINTLEGQVRSELESRGYPRAEVEILGRDEWVERRFHRFVLARRDAARQPPQEWGFGLRLLFDRPVLGPVSLGYASHFGLGLFMADDRNGQAK